MSGPRVGHIDEFGDSPVRKLRSELGVEAFGVNAWVLEPGTESRRHTHERQDELYFVHTGTPEIEIEGVVRNNGTDASVVLIVGASGGYVGRDGRPVEDGAVPGADG
jgi:quercetin dioxygenase-like cupin family protein